MMLHLRTVTLILAAAVLSPCGLLAQGTSQQLHAAEGARIFKNSCSVCHSLAPGQTKTGPSLSGIFQPPTATSERKVRRIITSGRGNMPAFKDRLSVDEISWLIEFLINRRKQ